MTTWMRLQPADRNPADLLDETTWQARAWEPLYTRCADCNGRGETWTDPDWPDTCTTCGGAGEIEDIRHGVSVCSDIDALVDYFTGRDIAHSADYVDRLVVVELEGQQSHDDDHDAHDGAYLLLPTRVVSVRPVPDELRAVIQDSGDDVEWAA